MDNVPVYSSLKERWNSLAREQRISAGILACCGIVALVFSIQRLGAGITDPFTVSRASFESAKKALNTIDPTKQLEAEARRRDTDGDGISDWDEEHAFGSSPYLADTDGDGTPDNVEIAYGTNPNCPSSKVCGAPKIDTSALSASNYPFLGEALTAKPGNQTNTFLAEFQRGINQSKQTAVQAGSTSTGLEPTLVRDPAEIRKAIRESGKIDEETLSKITDEQLLQLYDQAVVQSAQQDLQNQPSTTP